MKARWSIAAAVTLILALAGPASAVTNGDGDLITHFEGDIHPNRLPRTKPAPVAVRVAGDITSASGQRGRLPQLDRITVAINRGGVLFDRGLPVCRAHQIEPATLAQGRRACGVAIVGRGHVVVQVRIPGQAPFGVRARVLAYNGPRHGGRKLILAQAYARDPPGSFLMRFTVKRRPGTFGTVLTARLPPSTRGWAYLTHFDLTLRREYDHRGRHRSYVSAACPAPAGFDRVLFPFARATFAFVDGRRLTMSQALTCRASS